MLCSHSISVSVFNILRFVFVVISFTVTMVIKCRMFSLGKFRIVVCENNYKYKENFDQACKYRVSGHTVYKIWLILMIYNFLCHYDHTSFNCSFVFSVKTKFTVMGNKTGYLTQIKDSKLD